VATKTKMAADLEKPKTKKAARKEVKKVLFVASEAAPYIRSGGLGDVAGALPKSLQKSGIEVRVVIPLYADISSRLKDTMRFVGYTYVPLAWRNQYCGVFEQSFDGVKYYFIDNEYYFKRSGLYGHFDDAERYAFFSKAVLELLMLVDFDPDIIHCNDWHTALVPVFLDLFYRQNKLFSGIKTVFTIHNIEFQGKYDSSIAADILGIPVSKLSVVEYAGCTNYMKGGIECASSVTTVSPTYAEELTDPYFAYGLESLISARQFKLKGIINGIDIEEYNPMTDAALFKPFGADNLDAKLENKISLCKLVDLSTDPAKPLISMVTRLTSQKGVDLLTAIAEELLAADVQLVVLGTGDWKYETMLKDLEHRYKAKFSVIINFSRDIASKIYGGSDIFLMPSKFEPCGLSQMIAMRYGTVPVVRETGGLKDTVIPFNHDTKEGTGFSFYSYNAHDMLDAIWRAVDTFYNNKEDWKKIVKNAMSKDFSWDKSAEQYIVLYNSLLK
jgi:starch synthase